MLDYVNVFGMAAMPWLYGALLAFKMTVCLIDTNNNIFEPL